jgi:hypothetical protein
MNNILPIFVEDGQKKFSSDSNIRDVREEFIKITKQQPRNIQFEDNFKKSKLVLAHSLNQKNALTLENAKGIETQDDPYSAGYATVFKDNFRYDFVTGVIISYVIICPTHIGGNVNSEFYLTSTNRASRGVEAFIAYFNGQNALRFIVYDWAIEFAGGDPWQVNIPYGLLQGIYLSQGIIHGINQQYLKLESVTVKVDNTHWRNEVLLYNYLFDEYDLVYEYEYLSTTAEQKDGGQYDVGYWGPSVESWQSSLNNINNVGFNKIYLISCDANNNWGEWNLLSTANRGVSRNPCKWNNLTKIWEY